MTTESSIYIRNLRLHAPVGVLSQERVVGNDICVDLEMGYPFTKAMTTDSVDDTLNYAEAVATVSRVARQPVLLLERLAYLMATAIFERWTRTEWISISLTKVSPPMSADCDGAGVHLHLINDKAAR